MSETVTVDKAYLNALEREHDLGTQLLTTKVLNMDFRVVGDWIIARNKVHDLRPKSPDPIDVLRRLVYESTFGTPEAITFAGIIADARATLAAHDKEDTL